MITFDYELKQGFVLPLTELQECFLVIDRGEHRWSVNPELQTLDRRLYAMIQYSNPDPGGLPNAISYLFPVTEADSGDPLVTLHPSAGIPHVYGIHLEGPSTKHDVLEDWVRFWEPVRTALRSRVVSPTPREVKIE